MYPSFKQNKIEKEYVAKKKMYFNKPLRLEPRQTVIGHPQKLGPHILPVDSQAVGSLRCCPEDALSGRGRARTAPSVSSRNLRSQDRNPSEADGQLLVLIQVPDEEFRERKGHRASVVKEHF